MKAVRQKELWELGAILCCISCATAGMETGPAGDAELLEEKCTVCHGLSNISQARKTPTEWSRTVTRMRNKSPESISIEEAHRIADYLSRTYGKP